MGTGVDREEGGEEEVRVGWEEGLEECKFVG